MKAVPIIVEDKNEKSKKNVMRCVSGWFGYGDEYGYSVGRMKAILWYYILRKTRN